MTLEEVTTVLARHRAELRQLGAESLAVFGSTARGEANEESDVDLLVELNRPMGLFGLLDIQYRLEDLLGRPVDLVMADGLKPRVREAVLREAVRAA
jgi:hypothetical protein